MFMKVLPSNEPPNRLASQETRNNILGICKEITNLTLHWVTSRLVTPLKVIYSSIQVSNVCFYCLLKLINFSFRYFLFFPEMLANFAFDIVQIIPIILLGSRKYCFWLIYFGLIILSILQRTMVYSSSLHNNLNSLWQRNFYILSNGFPCFINIHLCV
jgi:hypothetical protein